MIETDVTAHRPTSAPLTAAKLGRTGAACLALLLMAAACSPPDAGVVTVNIAGQVSHPTTAGMAAPPPVGGNGSPVPIAGREGTTSAGTAPPSGGVAGGVAPPPTAGGISVPPPPGAAGSGGGVVGGTDRPPFNPGTDPARNQIRPGEICQRVSELQCAAEAHCCSAPKQQAAGCVSQLVKSCNEAFVDDIAKSERAGFNMAQAEQILNTLEMYSQTCDPQVTPWAASTAGLRAMVQGTIAANGSCMPMGLPGKLNYGIALASCAQATTTACLFTGNGPPAGPQSATCSPRADVGATCFVDPNCKDGLYCANSQMQYSSGKCQALKALGATCTLDTECATYSCRSAVCAAATVDVAYCLSQ